MVELTEAIRRRSTEASQAGGLKLVLIGGPSSSGKARAIPHAHAHAFFPSPPARLLLALCLMVSRAPLMLRARCLSVAFFHFAPLHALLSLSLSPSPPSSSPLRHLVHSCTCFGNRITLTHGSCFEVHCLGGGEGKRRESDSRSPNAAVLRAFGEK